MEVVWDFAKVRLNRKGAIFPDSNETGTVHLLFEIRQVGSMVKRIHRLEAKLEEIEAQLKVERSKAAKEERRLDTRRKIILGGRLQKLAETDSRAREIIAVAMQGLTDNEKRAFDGDARATIRADRKTATRENGVESAQTGGSEASSDLGGRRDE